MGYVLDWMLEHLDKMDELGCFKDPMAQLGAQTIMGNRGHVLNMAQANNYEHLKKSLTVENLFKDRYGINDYTDFDLDPHAKVVLDLTKPLPEEYKNRYNTVIDSGTLEHIFDHKSAFTNFYDMCKVGGYIIHITPVLAIEHGLFNHTMRLFSVISKTNDYPIVYSNIKKSINPSHVEDIDSHFYNYIVAMKKTNDEFKLPQDINTNVVERRQLIRRYKTA